MGPIETRKNVAKIEFFVFRPISVENAVKRAGKTIFQKFSKILNGICLHSKKLAPNCTFGRFFDAKIHKTCKKKLFGTVFQVEILEKTSKYLKIRMEAHPKPHMIAKVKG